MAEFGYYISVDEKEIIDNIKKEYSDYIKRMLKIIAPKIKAKIDTFIAIHILKFFLPLFEDIYSPIGEPDLRNKIAELVKEVTDNVEVEVDAYFSPTNELLDIGVNIIILKYGVESLLLYDFASYVTEKGQVIEWLRWLLDNGPQTVIVGYKFIVDNNSPTFSRTDLGIMRKTKNQDDYWRPPREIQGTEDDNFVKRALEDLGAELQVILSDELTRGFA